MSERTRLCAIVLVVVLCVLVWGCKGRIEHKGRADISVTNSYLACAVWDLCGDDTDVFCLAPPGVCPGHFDISPGQVKRLSKSRVLLLFDFQRQVEQTLSRIKDRGLKTGIVKEPEGLCVPQTYLTICKQVGDILSGEDPDRKSEFTQRLANIGAEMDRLREDLSSKMKQAGLIGAKVLASYHQAEFARWLGLDVVATFVGSDTETVANRRECLQKAKGQSVRFVIANQQEGTALAESLAQRLGANAVAFSNFPELSSKSKGFSDLLEANVGTLTEAAGI